MVRLRLTLWSSRERVVKGAIEIMSSVQSLMKRSEGIVGGFLIL